MSKMSFVAILTLVAVSAAAAARVAANPVRDAILQGLTGQAKTEDPEFSGFSAQRGETLFRTRHSSGKPDTPSCTICHTDSPLSRGRTRAGKVIDPMAVSKVPDRFTDARKVAKWFRRNCKSVLGRECTAREKGDFITFMLDQ